MWVLPVAVHLPFYGLIMAFGLFAGDWEERLTAAANVLGSVIVFLAGAAALGANMPVELGSDLCQFGLSVVVSLRSDKIWPLPFASLTLMVPLTDVAQALAHAHTWAFGAAQITWELLSDLLLAWATWRAWRRRSRRSGRATAGAPAMA